MSLRIAFLGALMLVMALFGSFAACSGTPTTPEGGSPDGKTDGATLDGGCWWCVDAGQPDEAKADEGNTTLPKDVDPTCYKACTGKGVSHDDCVNKHCKKKPPGGDCLKSCLAKGVSKEDCLNKFCKDNPGDCYNNCLKAGGTSDQCKTKCTDNKDDPKACNDACLKAGGKPADCELKCLGGGVPPKDREGQACYDACIKDGGKAETCKPKCFPTQICLDQCAKGGGKEAECNKKCATACYDSCIKNGGKEAECNARCGGTKAPTCDAKADPSLKQDVLPILNTSCSCHTTASSPAAGLSINSHKSIVNAKGKSGKVAVTPGDLTKSHLFDRIEGRGNLMPKGGPSLPAADIATIKAWICKGAKDN